MRSRTAALLALFVGIGAAGVFCFVADSRNSAHGPRAFSQARHPRVDDEAAILEPFAARIGGMADALQRDLGIDLQVVTTNDAEGSIETQADRIFQQKHIGAAAPTGGLLILLNPKLASARIEVGYTLEGGLTDLDMGRLARDQLAPYASYGVAGMATMDVLHQLRDHVYLAAALGNLALSENFKDRSALQEYQRFTSGGAGARAALPAVPIDSDLKRHVPDDTRPRYAASRRAEESVAAFIKATGDLAGDPTLDLFTEGSRLMRTYYPLARLEELQRLERIEASMPLEYLQHGDYIVATSKKPVKGFVPVLMHREQGLWRIDLVETWKNLFFAPNGNYFLRNSNTPYAFGLHQFGAGRHYDMAAMPLEAGPMADMLATLEEKQDALSALRRAEIWLRNGFVFHKAFAAYEAARRAAPEDPLVLQTLGERALYLGFPELAIPAYEQIGRGLELALADAYNQSEDRAGARRWIARALDENPYELQALHWQKFLAEKAGRSDEAQAAAKTIAMLSGEPGLPANPVALHFDPAVPRFQSDTTLNVGGTTVFDHSEFSVTMTNFSNQPVELESITLTSMGTAAASGLGDIRNYWHYPAGPNRLLAGEAITFKKRWGFTVDTGHQHVRYVFRICWRGDGSEIRQCRTQWVDTMPDAVY